VRAIGQLFDDRDANSETRLNLHFAKNRDKSSVPRSVRQLLDAPGSFAPREAMEWAAACGETVSAASGTGGSDTSGRAAIRTPGR